MYFVMLIVRFLLGTWGGVWGHPQLAMVRAGIPRGLPLAHRAPNNWNVASGHLRIRTPIRSPMMFRRLGSRPPTVLEQPGGRCGRSADL